MNLRDRLSKLEGYSTDWRRLQWRGVLLLGVGTVFALASAVNPSLTVLHGDDFSLLPLCGIVILAIGLLECLDAIMATESKDFLLSLQNALLDVVVAFLVIFSLGDKPARLALLIAGFLITKGLFRMILAFALQSPNTMSTRITSGISIILGFLVWREWPSSGGWFLAFCLSAEIGMRGWGLLMFASWLKAQASLNQTQAQ